MTDERQQRFDVVRCRPRQRQPCTKLTYGDRPPCIAVTTEPSVSNTSRRDGSEIAVKLRYRPPGTKGRSSPCSAFPKRLRIALSGVPMPKPEGVRVDPVLMETRTSAPLANM